MAGEDQSAPKEAKVGAMGQSFPEPCVLFRAGGFVVMVHSLRAIFSLVTNSRGPTTQPSNVAFSPPSSTAMLDAKHQRVGRTVCSPVASSLFLFPFSLTAELFREFSPDSLSTPYARPLVS